jgi:hypothetical protein
MRRRKIVVLRITVFTAVAELDIFVINGQRRIMCRAHRVRTALVGGRNDEWRQVGSVAAALRLRERLLLHGWSWRRRWRRWYLIRLACHWLRIGRNRRHVSQLVGKCRQVCNHLFRAVKSTVVIHRRFGVILRMVVGVGVEVVSKSRNTIVGEHTEDVTLVIVELWRCFSAENSKLFVKESLNTCKTEVCETRAVVEQSCDPLEYQVSFRPQC